VISEQCKQRREPVSFRHRKWRDPKDGIRASISINAIVAYDGSAAGSVYKGSHMIPLEPHFRGGFYQQQGRGLRQHIRTGEGFTDKNLPSDTRR